MISPVNIRRFVAMAFPILMPVAMLCQIIEPVKWKFDFTERGNDEYDIVFRAKIDKGWHLYSQEETEEGPEPTTFTFEKNRDFKLLGKVGEGKSLRAFEEILETEVVYFADEATFTQKIRKLVSSEIHVKGVLTFMSCNDKMCIPPQEIDFDVVIPASKSEKKAGDIIPLASDAVDIGGNGDQIYDPVEWKFSLSNKGGDVWEVHLKAVIEDGWHIYARELESDEGPMATEIVFDENPQFEFTGDFKEKGKLINEYDGNFMMNLSYFEDSVDFVRPFRLTGKSATIRGTVTFMTCDNEKCLPPEPVDFELVAGESPTEGTGKDETRMTSGSSFFGTFIKGFLGGFLALLTPCVFPMIPLTVSFFTKRSKNKAEGVSNAVIYGASIIAIYVLLGYGITMMFGADALNALSTNLWFNLAFFFLLVIFAISFFGAFEITLPASWVNKADNVADRGGLIGIFFMAFTLSLVSFSCTGPIIGTLLVDAFVNGGISGPLIGMFGFSLALALPFGLFAAFPGWLNSLPSSGGWLNSVKVFLGFLELAFAFKFLSNADLVVQAGLLKRELFIAIWIAIFALLTAYLLGFFRLPHDGEGGRISVVRLVLAIFTLMFTIYLVPGIWGAPLKLISGFPPPMFYSESPNGIGMPVQNSGDQAEVVGDPEHCPHHLNCFHDYGEGLAYAKEVNKPVLLDFTGWACVNCRKMEEQVWSDPSVLKILRDDLVLVSLYVDEKTPLPEAEHREEVIGGKKWKIRTIGNKWSYFQASRYHTNSQPHYVIIDHDENIMNGSAAYDPDIDKFRTWLEEGIGNFQKNSQR